MYPLIFWCEPAARHWSRNECVLVHTCVVQIHGMLQHIASVAIFAQMSLAKRLHGLRLYGLKPWEEAVMSEVDPTDTFVDPGKFTVAVELWWIVFEPHVDCPPQCMGAQGLKCVLLLADRERFVTMMAPLENLDDVAFLIFIEENYMCKRIAMRPTMMVMYDGDFIVNKNPPAWGSACFRLNPFLTGKEFLDMMLPKFGPSVRDWVLMQGEVKLSDNLSLLMQGIHEGYNDDDAPLYLRPPEYHMECERRRSMLR
jgi:hypothetical protein